MAYHIDFLGLCLSLPIYNGAAVNNTLYSVPGALSLPRSYDGKTMA